MPTEEVVEAGAQMPDSVVSDGQEKVVKIRSTAVSHETLDYEILLQDRAKLVRPEMAVVLGGLRQERCRRRYNKPSTGLENTIQFRKNSIYRTGWNMLERFNECYFGEAIALQAE